MTHPITLIGDGVENPGNANAMVHAAKMFGGTCRFRDRHHLQESWVRSFPSEASLQLVSAGALAATYDPVVALDNLEGACEIYGFNMPAGRQPALVVGNERHGLAREVIALAARTVEIPIVSRKLNCINVAAASAVALYYLSRGGGGKLQSCTHPEKRRPELMLVGAGDHVELGSSIRSAGAFGWGRMLVDDRAGVWFNSSRAVQAEGRAAARRNRNPIYIVPADQSRFPRFEEVCVITTSRIGIPLHRAILSRGPQQLIAIPDESCMDAAAENWDRLAENVKWVYIDLPTAEFVYHYRLITSIVLAEAARQVGRRTKPTTGRTRRHDPFYDSAFRLIVRETVEPVYLDELAEY